MGVAYRHVIWPGMKWKYATGYTAIGQSGRSQLFSLRNFFSRKEYLLRPMPHVVN